MGEELESIRCSKLYINGEEIENINDFSATWNCKAPDEYESINLSDNEFSCSFRVADKKLNTYHHLMKSSKSWRIRKKNNKKYHERFIEKYGILLGLE
jgi:hypothetical protein